MDETGNASGLTAINRALISVSNKTGLLPLAEALAKMGIEIFSTGGTARHLQEAGIRVRDVAEYTGFPEMMDGRVKTLHPKIFGGILCRRDHAPDMQGIETHGILPLDLVVVNLYPFAEAVSRDDCDRSMAIENIDIGGPSLIRAAAKNSQFVTVATSPAQYSEILSELQTRGGTGLQLRNRLMAEAFQHTAEYDRMIAAYFASPSAVDSALPLQIDCQLVRVAELRYGENSHQAAALYDMSGESAASLSRLQQLNGKELSFNNLLDINSALTIVSSFAAPACVVIKHNNPCGAATGDSLVDVVERAFQGDPVSAFGSIVALNRTLDEATAQFLAAGDFFVEAIVCPGFTEPALQILKTRPRWKKNVRLLQGPLVTSDSRRLDMRRVHGGMLVQQSEGLSFDPSEWKLATTQPVGEALRAELTFAWQLVRHVKSNAIVLARDLALCGVGAGQMSRVDAVRIAIEKAGDRAVGAVLASDAFFPFPDSIEMAARAGIAAVIQPGGSVKDAEVIEACQAHGIPMLLTGRRHFLH